MYRVMAGDMESESKGKMVWKVAPSTLVSLRRPLFEMSADLVEGLIDAAC